MLDLKEIEADQERQEILDQEVNQFSKIIEKQKRSWSEFRVSEPSKKNVQKYLNDKMNARQ